MVGVFVAVFIINHLLPKRHVSKRLGVKILHKLCRNIYPVPPTPKFAEPKAIRTERFSSSVFLGLAIAKKLLWVYETIIMP